MPRYFLNLAYNGTRFNGWQMQENTQHTVQQVIQEKMGKLLPEKQAFVTGCGRTDTGVHAEDFYLHFDTAREDLHADPRDFLFKLNKALPEDIGIKRVLKVTPKANARFDALSRTYEYRITRMKNPLLADFSWMIYGDLNLAEMQKAAHIILNTRNFKSFAKSNDQPHDNECIIHESEIFMRGEDLLIFKIKANRFLRNMVRALTGTIVDIGKGKSTLAALPEIIESGNRSQAGMSAPAKGLFLTKIEYPDTIFLNE